MNKILITGGAGGIGRAVSVYFSQMGWKVYSCDIKPHKPANNNIVPVIMDIRSTESIAAGLSIISGETKHLDIVLNIAGIYIMDSLVEAPEEDFTNIFDINVCGTFRVNKEFLPLVKNGGRIIIVTSELSRLKPLPFNGLYSIVKSTLETYADSLRLELALIGIPVITVRPGAVDTKLLDESMTSMKKMCKKTRLYEANAIKFQNIMEKVTRKPIPPEKLAEKIYRIAMAPNPRASYTIGASLALRLFSALPVGIQVTLLKKILG